MEGGAPSTSETSWPVWAGRGISASSPGGSAVRRFWTRPRSAISRAADISSAAIPTPTPTSSGICPPPPCSKSGGVAAASLRRPSGGRARRPRGPAGGSSHPDIFRDLPPAAMLEEWRVSRDILEQLLGEPCRAASLPGGDISPAVAASAGDAGLDFLFTSEPWLTPQRAGECWLLGRCIVKAATSVARVRALSRFRGWRRAQLVRGLKVAARRSLPPLYRRYVRWTTAERTTTDTGPLRAW